MNPLILVTALIGTTSSPVDDFVRLVDGASYSAAQTLIDGDVEVNADMRQQTGPTTPAARVIAFVSKCRVAKDLVKSEGQYTEVWWNCGTELNAQGGRMRSMVAVDVWPSGAKVKLKNFLVGRFPDTEKSLQDK